MVNSLKKVLKQEDGVGVVEVVLILAVIVGIALIFRNQIMELVNRILDHILGRTEIFTQ